MRVRFLALIMVFAASACGEGSTDGGGPIAVQVVANDSGYQLLRGGETYLVKGAGMEVDDFAQFAAHGGNSIRNWTTRNPGLDTRALLDTAHTHNVTVSLCLPMTAERHGFDYDNDDAVAEQLEAFRQDVLRYRDHPALLTWIIGNELNHEYTNPRVYDAVNDIAKMIHQLDPNHPVTTTIAGFEAAVVDEITARAPELDFLSFQAYGSLFELPQKIADAGFDSPFMVTEWGAIGYWEVSLTQWGAPIEATSSAKADTYQRAYREILQPLDDLLLGSYAFLWGQKQERTPTWFGMVTEWGEKTEAIDVMHRLWTGRDPINRAPRVESLRLDGKVAEDSVRLVAGLRYLASFDVSDPDGDTLVYHWELKPESRATQSGGDPERRIPNIDAEFPRPSSHSTEIVAPEPGSYRLFAYARDGEGSAAHANIPFLVEAEQ